MARLWKNYSLSIVLAVLFIVSWGIQTYAGWQKYSNEQIEKHQKPEVFGQQGYVWDWAAATFENWQSEFLQLLSFVVLTSFLIHKGSHESKDGDEEMKALILDIRNRLDRLEKSDVRQNAMMK